MAHLQRLLISAPQSAPLERQWRDNGVSSLLTRCRPSVSLIRKGARRCDRSWKTSWVMLRKSGPGMSVAGMLMEALKGAVREAWGIRGAGPVQRVVIFVGFLVTIVREVLGTLKLVPYGVYAFCLYASLISWRKDEKEDQQPGTRWSMRENVVVARDVRYGQAQRNLLDVYVPRSRTVGREGAKPVVIFVHGGVWASGVKWQFSPLGVFLAEQGVVAVLVQYTLYPEVLVIDQVSEVSDALTWTMDNIAEYCGDPSRVFLMGHSSGAHLCSMVLWERARRRLDKLQHPIPEQLDIRIPLGFLGLAGVYNIGEHYKYEVRRGVGAISCMRPAMGGEKEFDAMSPSLLFESLLIQGGVVFGKKDFIDPTSGILVRGVDLVPTCLFSASHKDIVVPPASSFAFNSMLQTLGCESRVILLEGLNHEDFVLWHRGWGILKAHISPFVEVVINFVTSSESQ